MDSYQVIYFCYLYCSRNLFTVRLQLTVAKPHVSHLLSVNVNDTLDIRRTHLSLMFLQLPSLCVNDSLVLVVIGLTVLPK